MMMKISMWKVIIVMMGRLIRWLVNYRKEDKDYLIKYPECWMNNYRIKRRDDILYTYLSFSRYCGSLCLCVICYAVHILLSINIFKSQDYDIKLKRKRKRCNNWENQHVKLILIVLVLKLSDIKPGKHGYNVYVKVVKVEHEEVKKADGSILNVA